MKVKVNFKGEVWVVERTSSRKLIVIGSFVFCIIFRAAIRLKILIAVNRMIKIFLIVINRTRTRNTSLWHRITV